MPDVFTVFLNKDDDDDSLGERGGGGRGGGGRFLSEFLPWGVWFASSVKSLPVLDQNMRFFSACFTTWSLQISLF